MTSILKRLLAYELKTQRDSHPSLHCFLDGNPEKHTIKFCREVSIKNKDKEAEEICDELLVMSQRQINLLMDAMD